MNNVKTVIFNSEAKINGSGRKTKFVGFSQRNDPDGSLIIGELLEINHTENNGDIALIKASDNNEHIQVFLNNTTLYAATGYKKQWLSDMKKDMDILIDFEETEKVLKSGNTESIKTSIIDKKSGEVATKEIKSEDEIKTRVSLSHYVLHKNHQTEGGRPVFDVDDDVAKMLIDLPHKEIIPFTARTLKSWGVTEIGRGKAKGKVTVPALTERWGHLNKGQIRMNAGNVLRSAFKKRIDEGKE